MGNDRAVSPPETILIVDDAPHNLRLLARILGERGYEVRIEQSGTRALAAARASPPDLILLDVKLPEMDGYQICQRLQADWQTRDIPVIFISVLEEMKDKLKGFDVGGADYITKPFQAAEVLARAETHLALGRTHRQLQATNRELERRLDELARSQEALRESEAKYRELVESANSIIFRMDTQGHVTFFNEYAQRFFGYTEREIMGKHVVRTIVPETESTGRDLTALIQDILQDPDHYANNENENMRRNGERVWVAWTNKAVRDGTGRVTGVLCIGNDITARVRAEKALRRRDAVLEAINAAARRFLSATSWTEHIQEALGRLGGAAEVSRVYIFENDVDEDGALLAIQRYEWAAPGIASQIDTPKPQGFCYQSQGFDRWIERLGEGQIVCGHVREFPKHEQEALVRQGSQSILVVPIFVEEAWWGFVGFDECSTEREWSEAEIDALQVASGILGATIQRERAQEALQESEERLRALVESADDIIVMQDLEGRYVYYNVAPQYGLSASEVLGKTPFDFFDSTTATRIMEALKRVADSGEPELFENPVVWRGQRLWFSHYIYPVKDDDGQVICVGTIARNIAERVRAEEQRDVMLRALRERTAQLEALREVGLKLSAHLDLDSVLHSVVSRAVELLKGFAGGLNLYRPERDVLEVAVNQGDPPVPIGNTFRRGEGLVGKVWEHGEPLIVNDYLHWEGRTARHGELHISAVGAPIRWGQEFLGTLVVIDKALRNFSAADADLLSLFATQAAIAIENARLYEWARRDAEAKAALLHEVNHRVGNNLAVLIGLLEIEQEQAEVANHPGCQVILRGLTSRLQGLATVHHMLSAAGWAPLRLDELSREIIETVLRLLPGDKDVSVGITPSEVRVTPKQAHNLVLVINELAVNALKYAWQERGHGHITVGITLEYGGETVRFEFRDDGPGYPEAILGLKHDTVGLDLIRHAVSHSLDGELTLHNDAGAVAVIRFPATAEGAKRS